MTMAMDLIRHIAGLYSGKAIKGDFTQVYITGNEIWMAQQILASQQGEQCPQCDGSGKVSDSDGCGVWYIDCQTCAKKHPEQAEGAQGEREALSAYCAWYRGVFGSAPFHAKENQEFAAFKAGAAWQARAALAQPSPAPELERPEVVGTLLIGEHYDGSKSVDATRSWHTEGLEIGAHHLMTVAQHDRIVGALRAESAKRGVRLSEMHEDIRVITEERDAAQARVAELEQSTQNLRQDRKRLTSQAVQHRDEIEALRARLSDLGNQVPEGYALIPTRLLLDKELIECIAFHCSDGGGSYGDYQDGILFIGEITDDDGRQVHGLHLACAECEEDGYTTLVEFAAAPAQGGEL